MLSYNDKSPSKSRCHRFRAPMRLIIKINLNILLGKYLSLQLIYIPVFQCEYLKERGRHFKAVSHCFPICSKLFYFCIFVSSRASLQSVPFSKATTSFCQLSQKHFQVQFVQNSVATSSPKDVLIRSQFLKTECLRENKRNLHNVMAMDGNHQTPWMWLVVQC